MKFETSGPVSEKLWGEVRVLVEFYGLFVASPKITIRFNGPGSFVIGTLLDSPSVHTDSSPETRAVTTGKWGDGSIS